MSLMIVLSWLIFLTITGVIRYQDFADASSLLL